VVNTPRNLEAKRDLENIKGLQSSLLLLKSMTEHLIINCFNSSFLMEHLTLSMDMLRKNVMSLFCLNSSQDRLGHSIPVMCPLTMRNGLLRSSSLNYLITASQ
jgi:hypothetical protein